MWVGVNSDARYEAIDWGLQNILDEKAAEIYDLSESVKGDMYKTINGLEQLLSQSQKLLNAINIKED